MGETLQIRNVDPLNGGQVEISAPLPALPPEGYSLFVRRGTAQNPFLGPDGWQQVEYSFVATQSRIEGDRLLLTFGPDLVDSALRDQDVVQLHIPEIDAGDVLVWEGITRSVSVSEEAVPAAPVTPRVDPDATTVEVEEPIAPPLPEPEPEPEPETEPQLERKHAETGEPGGRNIWLWLIPLVLLFGLILFLFLRPEPTSDPEPTTTDETTAPAREEATPAPAASALERGRAALENGQCDQARDLLRRALQEGSGEASLLWAENQDSLDFEECLTETPNDIQALTRYGEACERGVPGVLEKLDALEAELIRRRDQDGDVTAGEVLRLSMQKTRAQCE